MRSTLQVLQENLAAAKPPTLATVVANPDDPTPKKQASTALTPDPGLQSKVAVERLVAMLEETTSERDQLQANTGEIIGHADELQLELQLIEEKNQRIFRQLEDALTISVQPLDKMFRSVGLKTETLR